MEIGDFDIIMQNCGKIFTYWDDEQQNLQTVTPSGSFLEIHLPGHLLELKQNIKQLLALSVN